jgi:SAM-dependent methyltransferase
MASLGEEFWMQNRQVIPGDAEVQVLLGDLDKESVKLWAERYTREESEVRRHIEAAIGYFSMLRCSEVRFAEKYAPFSLLIAENETEEGSLVAAFHLYKGETGRRPFICIRRETQGYWYHLYSRQFDAAWNDAATFVLADAPIEERDLPLQLRLLSPGKRRLVLGLNYGELAQCVGYLQDNGGSLPAVPEDPQPMNAILHGNPVVSRKDLVELPLLPLVDRRDDEGKTKPRAKLRAELNKALDLVKSRIRPDSAGHNLANLQALVPIRWLSFERESRKGQPTRASAVKAIMRYPELVALVEGIDFRYPVYPRPPFIEDLKHRGESQLVGTHVGDADRPADWTALEACPSCSEGLFEPLHIVGYSRIVRCQNCDLQFQNPRPKLAPDDMDRYVPDSDDDSRTSAEARAKEYAGLVTRDVRTLRGMIQPTSILEIGCSSGEFLESLSRTMKLSIERMYGVEPSPKGADAARKKGIALCEQFAEECDFRGDFRRTNGQREEKPKPFNLVLMLNTFEHLDSPLDVLRRLHAAMASGGLLGIFTVPNVTSLAGTLFPLGFMPKNFPDAHDRFFFSPTTLQRMAEAARFRVCRPLEETFRNPFGRRRSIETDKIDETARWLAFNCGVPDSELWDWPRLRAAWRHRVSQGLGRFEGPAKTRATMEFLKRRLESPETEGEQIVDIWRNRVWEKPELSEVFGIWLERS